MINVKKIMQINITCGVGSTGRISASLYDATLKEGNLASFTYSAYKPTIKKAFRIENTLQNVMRRALNKYFGCKQKHSSAGTKRLIRFIKKQKPDLIHLHNVQQNSVNYILLFDYLKQQNIPVVFTLHDCWAFTGGCYHFTHVRCDQYQTGCARCPRKRMFDDVTIQTNEAYKIKSKLIGNNPQIYPVCVSKWLCNVAQKSYMGKMEHLPRVIYNGIDNSVFFPRKVDKLIKCGVDNDVFTILGVASFWTEDKGLSLFLEIRDKINYPFKIVLIGGGLEKVKSLNDERIICVDRTESVIELAEYYSLADVFINTSIEETFGLTTAEALACGTPAIVFNSTACPEVIDEKTGICVEWDEHGDDNVLDAIAQIYKKGKEHYSNECVKRVNEMFTNKLMIENYLRLYEEILGEKRSSKN